MISSRRACVNSGDPLGNFCASFLNELLLAVYKVSYTAHIYDIVPLTLCQFYSLCQFFSHINNILQRIIIIRLTFGKT